jgi:hypothetical protein
MLPRLVWLLVDGLSYEMVAAYARAKPHSRLAAWWQGQRVHALEPLAPNCQTPPSLFTIWSGADVAAHGLTGYDIPTARSGSPTDHVGAFGAWPRELKMVWDHYAAEGRHVRTCAVPFLQPQRLAPWLLSATDVFGPPLIEACVLGDGEVLACPALDLSWSVRVDGDQIELRASDGRLAWRSKTPDPPLPLPADACRGVSSTHLAVALRTALIDGRHKLICLGCPAVVVHGEQAAQRESAGVGLPYVVANPGKLYARSALGRRLDDGGNGDAEALLLSLLRDVHDGFARDVSLAVRSRDADLVVGYYPLIDLMSHQLLKHAVTPDRHFGGPQAEAFITALHWLEEFIVGLADEMDAELRFVVHSDHGMSPIRWEVHPNRFFLEKGWLSCDAEGRIDAQRSLVFFHPAENGLLVFHRERLQAAGLTSSQVVHALAEAVERFGLPGLGAIASLAAPLGQEWQADQYLQCPPDARPRADSRHELVRPSAKGGDHTVYSTDPWLRGALIDAGKTQALPLAHPGKSLRLSALLSLLTRESGISSVAHVSQSVPCP